MSRTVWKNAKIRDAGTTSGDASEIVISKIITEGIEFDGDGKMTVNIANNQPVTEAYQRGFTIRVQGANHDGGAAILADANVYSDPASDTLTQALIELQGETGADSVEIDDVYIMGEDSFANGRRETILSCMLEAISDPYSIS